MDLAFYLPRLHERLPVTRKPPVRGRGAADEGHALGLEGGSPGDNDNTAFFLTFLPRTFLLYFQVVWPQSTKRERSSKGVKEWEYFSFLAMEAGSRGGDLSGFLVMEGAGVSRVVSLSIF